MESSEERDKIIDLYSVSTHGHEPWEAFQPAHPHHDRLGKQASKDVIFFQHYYN